jgi:sugar phosphate isomerase/epimerase
MGLGFSFKSKKLPLSFSTLGCPDWNFDQILKNAVEMGYQAIELRGLGKELDLLNCSEFKPENIKETLRKVKDKNLKIINLGSSANLHFHEAAKRTEQLVHAKRYIELAEKLECPFIRVFPNNIPKEFPKEATFEKISTGLTELGNFAKNTNVKILMETHGDLIYIKDIKNIMQSVNLTNTGLIWDFFNMFVITHENPADMYAALKPYIFHVHLKDGIIDENGKFNYVFPGKGNAPLRQVIELLKKDKYKGFYSFEWEKRWHPEISAPEQAFQEYITYMKSLNK